MIYCKEIQPFINQIYNDNISHSEWEYIATVSDCQSQYFNLHFTVAPTEN
jgi:hypothetical protein